MKVPSIPNNSILGINYSGMHDSAISIVSPTGEVIFASSLERVTRVKQDGRPPHKLLELIDFSKISKIGVSTDKELDISIDKESEIHPLRLPFSNNSKSDYLIHGKPFYDFFSKFEIPVHFVCHQLSHAASAFWMSGLKEATCFTYDGGMNNSVWFGGMYSASMDNGIQVLDRFSITKYAKITTLYSVITGLLGFTPNKHEGKITGLAAYGKLNEKCESVMKKMLAENYKKIEGLGEWLFSYSEEKAPAYFVDPERRKEILSLFDGISKEDIAYNLQRITENHVIEILANAKKKNFLSKSICLAGGLFANVKINQRVKEFGFENIFVVPPMTDDGAGLGAALHLASQNKEFKPQKIKSMFLGFDFSKSEIEESLKQNGIVFEKIENPVPKIIDELVKGSIIGIFQGKMEFGPRSLGNRTIIGQANRKEINTELNHKLKRTEFMPFAPITRLEDAKNCYLDFAGAEFTAEFMTITFQCTKEMIEKSPAVVHIDDTARPEFITKESNSFLYEILSAYKEKTGIASLINTSFNIHEEPIVCSPDDAIEGFLESGLDYLYLEGGYLVSFEANIKNALHLLQEKGLQKSQSENLYRNALELYSRRFNEIFIGSKQKEEKILEQQGVLEKQNNILLRMENDQKEKDALLLAQDTAQKEKDALIHKHHKFAHELMDELKKRNIQFTTQWPSE
jgi:carbamoyltransferase